MAQPERHVRVRAGEFSPERLDTGFYARAYFDTREAIRGSGLKTESIGSVCEPWQFGAYALCNHIEWSDAASGVPYIKAEALGSPLLNESGLAYVTSATHRLLEKSQLKPGDIVVSTSGTIGLCAVLPERLGEANSNQDTIKFNPSSAGYDCYFVAAWIASAPGQVFLHREAGGAVQQHVYLYNFKRLPLLKIATEAQRYIGDKVRQAERLRERARQLRTSVTNRFLDAGFPAVPRTYERIGRVRASDLNDRLDALHYRQDLLRNLEDIRRHKTVCLGSPSDFTGLADGDHGNPTYGDGPLYVRATELTGGLLDSRSDVRLAEGYSAGLPASVWATSEDVLFSIVATLGAVGALEGGARAVLSRGVAKVRPLTVPHAYLKAYMRTPAFGSELLRRSVGTIQRGVYLESLQTLDIPVLEPSIMNSIAEAESAADACVVASQLLSVSAKLLVEQLIEGRIAEADLAAAQKELEAGDRSADREFLKSLRQSDAPDAKPLIADVDALYALLDGSEGQDA